MSQRGKGQRLFIKKEGQYYASRRINLSREGVDSDDMIRSFVPRAVFPPVRRGNLVPRVVESAIERIDPHSRVVAGTE